MILTETQLRNAAFSARSLNRYYTYSSIQFIVNDIINFTLH